MLLQIDLITLQKEATRLAGNIDRYSAVLCKLNFNPPPFLHNERQAYDIIMTVKTLSRMISEELTDLQRHVIVEFTPFD